MSSSIPGQAMQASISWRDYYVMCKPNVVLLMLLTTLVGMLLSTTGMIPLKILIVGHLGIGMAAASAAIVNHILDRRIDAQMSRTQNRPLPQGKVPLANAIILAMLLGISGISMLAVYVNLLTAVLTLAALFGYAFVYTGFLKRATPQNIVIGGISGAMPPLLGWVAVTNTFEPNSLLLVLIISVWTPPHFWALAMHKRAEYDSANIPMLPVTHGLEFTGLQVLLYTILMVLATLLPYVVGMSGLIYLLSATLLNLRFLYWAWKLYRADGQNVAMNTFWYSIIYLALLFIALLVDHYFLIYLLPD
jgi:protoheme IX farnesyltransferase